MGKKPLNKQKPNNSKENTPTNQVVGLDGNQLLEVINRDSGKTLLKLQVSSAMHDKAQEQLNRSSQQLHEKATSQQRTQNETQLNSALYVCSININCSTNAMHELAHNITMTRQKFDIVLVQEPWWNGNTTTSFQGWQVILPTTIKENDCCRQ